jgi:galacturan 1,4-alpha-galacturonidase
VLNNTGNTDGADTFFSSNLTFSNWLVDNGDDSISFKANSTDMIVKDCEFNRGLGVAIGSIGQYLGVFETIERIFVTRVTFKKTLHAVRYQIMFI